MDIAVGTRGRAYVTGDTFSPNFPTTPGAFDTSFNDSQDAFVTKFNARGSALVYSTFLGGTGDDEGFGIGVLDRMAYVTGDTQSADYPTTPGALDRTFDGSEDAFVTKLNRSGSALAYSTLLGGEDADFGSGIAVVDRRAYVTGFTNSPNFPTTRGAFDRTFNGGASEIFRPGDAFVTKLNATGSALAYSTFLGGGAGSDFGNGIAVDGRGMAYVTGFTTAPDFPTTRGAFDTTFSGGFRGTDAFVTKLPTG